MNQILATSMPMDDRRNKNKPKKEHKPIEIGIIIKVFAMITLIFGTTMVGTGAYAIYKNELQIKEENLQPTFSIEYKTDEVILLKILHQKTISKIEYGWNDGQKTVVNGNNGKYLEQEITLTAGKNTLNVIVHDEDGKQITYNKEYEIESNINLEVAGNKIKISYESATPVAYMTYRWDDGEETTITINDTVINEEIDVMKGLHELTVIVVDQNNNTDTKVQKINGVSKPELEIDYNEEVTHFVIKTSDDEQLSKIEFILNQNESEVYVLNIEEMNLKELEYTLPMELQTGENILEVTVYNINGLSTYSGVRLVKQ